MESVHHLNYRRFLQSIYHEVDPMIGYEPTPAVRQAAIRRGNANSMSTQRANALFDRLTKKGGS